MIKNIMWKTWDGNGIEHLRLMKDHTGVIADGLVVSLLGEQAFRVRYNLRLDDNWRVRQCSVEVLDLGKIELFSDGEGHWTNGSGDNLVDLDGCLDVDISITPFTNTIPIRRLSSSLNQSSELKVVYISIPSLQIRKVQQRYFCLGISSDGANYLYQSLESGFTAQLSVDCDGLIKNYPKLFRRIL